MFTNIAEALENNTLIHSVILTYWVGHPKNKHLRGILFIGFILAILLPVIALLNIQTLQ